jgi:hypothetical protein
MNTPFLFYVAVGATIGCLICALVLGALGRANIGTLISFAFPALLWIIYWASYGRR